MFKSCAVVVFNFVDFEIHDLPQRSESVYDVKELQKLFFVLGASIYLVKNPNLEEFKNEIEKLSKYDFTNFEAIILVYMSHGNKKNILYCKDGQFNFMEESQKIFKNESLKNKPKYIVVEACKGEFDIDLDPYDGNGDCSDDTGITAVVTSSFEGFVSKLGTEEGEGSMFIKKFSEIVRKSWNKSQSFTSTLKEFVVKFNDPNYQMEQTAVLSVQAHVDYDNDDYPLAHE